MTPGAPTPGETTLDRLAGTWKILQLRDGHRFSADDMLVAWLAARVAPEAQRLLDLGAGIGSVGLMTLWALEDRAPSRNRTLTMLEAQTVSHDLSMASVSRNGLQARVTGFVGDLRAPLPFEGSFDLITGSPPYFPLGTGKVSPHPQKAACRMELRGTIADYAMAARGVVGDGWFVACFPARDPRGERAFAPAGLTVHTTCDVTFREGMGPMIRLYAVRALPGPTINLPGLTIRQADGRWTPDYLRVRAEMGSPMDPLP